MNEVDTGLVVALVGLVAMAIAGFKEEAEYAPKLFWGGVVIMATATAFAALPQGRMTAFNAGVGMAGMAVLVAYVRTPFLRIRGKTRRLFSDELQPYGWSLSTPKTWWMFVLAAILFGYPAYDFANQRYPYLILGLYISFTLSVGARYGYVDRFLDHSFAAGQYVQFALVSILTLGLFPASYLAMYFGGQHWITKTEAHERHSRARTSREQT
ncbi:hypothetical protein [Mycolicibacterium llatzerense]|uniref:hypothetical protein n=1 Tax=Mycolicibacterium llatzerense TaxID=280871 RepID=UPI0021B69A8C|nr:hypothetical protein [Mycolicibacterium llatzerense]MCT7369173.1 hypothetical protein [Mycolicibacterium llatzerense]